MDIMLAHLLIKLTTYNLCFVFVNHFPVLFYIFLFIRAIESKE